MARKDPFAEPEELEAVAVDVEDGAEWAVDPVEARVHNLEVAGGGRALSES